MISNMQKETKAKLINALPPEGDTLWIAVAIVGGMQSLKAAYKAISDLVEGGELRISTAAAHLRYSPFAVIFLCTFNLYFVLSLIFSELWVVLAPQRSMSVC